MKTEKDVIEIKNLSTQLGSDWIHKNLNLSVRRGEILGIVGSSGSGKTTLLREMLLLLRPTSGSIRLFDQEFTSAKPDALLALQQRWGVLFQQNALFTSLTVLENVSFPLQEHGLQNKQMIQELALLKIVSVGLPITAAIKYPAELSGGMEKRAALARALVLDPEILFLDEPTAGLDPDSAAGLDELILDLQESIGLTVVVVTHDLDTLWKITDRVAFLAEKKVLCVDSMENLVKNRHPLIHEFFNGPRGRAAKLKSE